MTAANRLRSAESREHGRESAGRARTKTGLHYPSWHPNNCQFAAHLRSKFEWGSALRSNWQPLARLESAGPEVSPTAECESPLAFRLPAAALRHSPREKRRSAHSARPAEQS